MQHKVSVVIPNWNGKKFLPLCLSSLRNQTYANFEIILVDNNSKDGSVELVAQNFPEVIIVTNKVNRGFAGGVNDGIHRACNDSKYIVVLNNDTKADSKWLEKLVEGAERQWNIGMCASKVLKFDKASIIDSAGLAIYRDLDGFRRGRGRTDTAEFDTMKEVFGPVGSAALYRKSMLDEIGLFDEDFFAYVEDIELAWRARLAGWKCMYIPTSVIYHVHSGTLGEDSPKILYYKARNKFYMIFKLFNMWTTIKSFFYYNIRFIIVAVKIKKRNNSPTQLLEYPVLMKSFAIMRGTFDAFKSISKFRKKGEKFRYSFTFSDGRVETLIEEFKVDEKDLIPA